MKTISVIGLGNRGYEYSSFVRLLFKRKACINAICDISLQALKDLKPIFKLNDDQVFDNTDDFFNKGVLSDGLIIATQDKTHYEITKKAIEVGYKTILLEKPVSDNVFECLELERLAKENKVTLLVCHVLRYSNFFLKIKEILSSGELGDLIHINHTENVGFFHFAHSYVRGNWHKEENSTNSLLAKCCHDIDLIYWFSNGKCIDVNSYGSLKYFNKNNCPSGASEYCLKECKVKDKCPYDCEYTYITVPFYKATFIKYNSRTMTGKLHANKKDMYDCLNNTSYGKCVFLSDNDVMDNQVVNMKFDNGVTATHTMNAFSNKMCRSGHIICSKGEILYYDKKLVVNIFGKKSKTYHPDMPLIPGHGEADYRIIKSFIDLLYGNVKNKAYLTTISETIESHKIVMASEKSRKNNNVSYNPMELFNDGK